VKILIKTSCLGDIDSDVRMSKVKKVGVARPGAKTPTRDRHWDSKSDISDVVPHHGPHSHQNSYKLSPDDDRKFRPSQVETLMYNVLKEFLSDVEYDRTLGQRMSKMLADTIKTRVKEFKWTRYKLVVHIVIGENREQEIVAGSRFLWSTDTDTYASTKFVTRSIFALAVCFGVYYD